MVVDSELFRPYQTYKFHHFNQISQFGPNFTNLTKSHKSDQISQILPNITNLTNFHNVDHISQFANQNQPKQIKTTKTDHDQPIPSNTIHKWLRERADFQSSHSLPIGQFRNPCDVLIHATCIANSLKFLIFNVKLFFFCVSHLILSGGYHLRRWKRARVEKSHPHLSPSAKHLNSQEKYLSQYS